MFSCSFVYAHYSKTDSLEILLKNSSGTKEIDLLLELSQLNIESDPVLAQEFGQKAFNLALEIDYKSGVSQAYLTLGILDHNGGNFPEAIQKFQQALEINRSQKNESQIGYCYYRIGFSTMKSEQLPDAIKLLRKALTILEKVNDIENSADAYANLGYCYWHLSEYDSALVNYQTALQINQRLGNRAKNAPIMNSIGVLYWQWAKYDKALEYYLESYKIREEINDKAGIIKVLNNIGKVYAKLGNTQKATEYFFKALTVSRETKDNSSIGYAFYNVGTFFASEQQYDSALVYFEKSISAYQKAHLLVGVALNLNEIGNIYLNLGDNNKAIENFQSAINLAKESGNKLQMAFALKNLGLAYRQKNNLRTALPYFEKSIEISKKISQPELMMENFHQVAEIYEALNDHRIALIYFKNYESLKDSIYSMTTTRKMSEIMSDYENQKAFEISKKEKELEEAKLKKQRVITLAFVIGLFLSLVLVVVMVHANRLLKISNKKIEEKSHELELANFGKDRFFSLIAHDLRNPFNTLISFVNLMNLKIDQFSKQEILMLTQELKGSVDNTRNLLENLLQWAQSQTGKLNFNPSDIDISILLNEGIEEQKLQAETKQIHIKADFSSDELLVLADVNMLRTVIRNLISNAIKFTHNGGIITLETKTFVDYVEISVSDSGIGIDNETIEQLFLINAKISKEGTAGERGSGLGLMLCKEFIEKNGGKLAVESEVGKGSKFSFTLKKAV